MNGIGDAIGGALVIAAVSTFGDYLWANVIPHRHPIFGLTHGALLFLAVGLYLGARANRPAIGAAGGALLGLLAAAGFYVLQPVLGYSSMFLLYIGVWVGLGLLNGRVLQGGRPEACTTTIVVRTLVVRTVVVRTFRSAVGKASGRS